MTKYVASILWAFTCFAGVACGDDAESCEPLPLADACGSKCPKNRAEAIAAVCASDGGQPRGEGWNEAKNSCGGINVENTTGPFGEIFSFDRDGNLVGVVGWSDTNDGPCNSFDTYYGKRCDGAGRTEHACPGGS